MSQTTGIDAASLMEFYSLLSELRRQSMTIVMVTHDITTAAKMATKVVYMTDGKATIYENPGNFLENFTSNTVRQGGGTDGHA